VVLPFLKVSKLLKKLNAGLKLGWRNLGGKRSIKAY